MTLSEFLVMLRNKATVLVVELDEAEQQTIFDREGFWFDTRDYSDLRNQVLDVIDTIDDFERSRS